MARARERVTRAFALASEGSRTSTAGLSARDWERAYRAPALASRPASPSNRILPVLVPLPLLSLWALLAFLGVSLTGKCAAEESLLSHGCWSTRSCSGLTSLSDPRKIASGTGIGRHHDDVFKSCSLCAVNHARIWTQLSRASFALAVPCKTSWSFVDFLSGPLPSTRAMMSNTQAALMTSWWHHCATKAFTPAIPCPFPPSWPFSPTADAGVRSKAALCSGHTRAVSTSCANMLLKAEARVVASKPRSTCRLQRSQFCICHVHAWVGQQSAMSSTLRRSTSMDKFSNQSCNRVPLCPLQPTLCNSTAAAARVCCRRAITMAGSCSLLSDPSPSAPQYLLLPVHQFCPYHPLTLTPCRRRHQIHYH
mmetsp:Transcript_67468/g.109408  ORF Transcript_67468/g.109408 Transcript_67468/m.109408 type:complete len:366 (-) Transcript_67468:1252-2349(-)